MRPPHTLFLLALVVPTGRADDPAPPTLPDVVRQAVAARQLTDSENFPFGADRASFRELAGEGGVLVGLEVGLSEWFGTEIPHAVRPIYREGAKEWTGGTAGSLSDPRVKRTVRVTARPGYAVGGMWVRTGAGMDRLCLRYMRVRDGHLDPLDWYASEWVGTSDGGSEKYVDGGGRPVVGVFSDAPRTQARNLGFTFARVPLPPPPKKDEPKDPGPKVEQPAAAAEAGPRKPSNLELEGAARKEDGGIDTVMLIALLAAVAVPMVVVAFLMARKGEKPPADDPDGRAELPRRKRKRRPVRDGQPLDERPGLAARVKDQLPATRAKDRPAGEVPPYFLVRATYRARAQRLTRVYVLPKEILVIDAGPGADVNVAAGLAAAALTGGGVIGAVIGGAVGTMVADDQKAKGEVYQARLDRLDLAGLLEWATEEGNFRARFEDLVGLTVDPPPEGSFWREKSRAAGVFRFRHLQRGEYTFEFLSGVEVRGAVELLRRAAPDVVHVGTGWDEATARYLDGV